MVPRVDNFDDRSFESTLRRVKSARKTKDRAKVARLQVACIQTEWNKRIDTAKKKREWKHTRERWEIDKMWWNRTDGVEKRTDGAKSLTKDVKLRALMICSIAYVV